MATNKKNFSPQNEVEPNNRDSIVPQHVLDIVNCALQPYRIPWEPVRKAILFPRSIEPESASAPVLDRFMCTEEIASLLHVSRVTIFRYMRAGKIKSHKLGRRNLYSVAEVMAAVKGGTADA